MGDETRCVPRAGAGWTCRGRTDEWEDVEAEVDRHAHGCEREETAAQVALVAVQVGFHGRRGTHEVLARVVACDGAGGGLGGCLYRRQRASGDTRGGHGSTPGGRAPRTRRQTASRARRRRAKHRRRPAGVLRPARAPRDTKLIIHPGRVSFATAGVVLPFFRLRRDVGSSRHYPPHAACFARLRSRARCSPRPGIPHGRQGSLKSWPRTTPRC